MRTIFVVLALSLSLPASVSLAQTSSGDDGSVVHKAGEAIKEGGQAVGHAARDTTKAIGHATRKVARKVGHGTRKAATAVGHGTRDAVHGVGDAASEAVGSDSSKDAGK
jgi:hypothetical protein